MVMVCICIHVYKCIELYVLNAQLALQSPTLVVSLHGLIAHIHRHLLALCCCKQNFNHSTSWLLFDSI